MGRGPTIEGASRHHDGRERRPYVGLSSEPQIGGGSWSFSLHISCEPTPSINNIASVERFSSAVSNTVLTLRALNHYNDLRAIENLRRVALKLPAELSYQWGREVHQMHPKQPDLEIFSKWLETETAILRNSANHNRDPERKRPSASARETSARRTTLTTSATSSQTENNRRRWFCVLCKEQHKLQDCTEFKSKMVEERLVVVSKERLCWGCLNKGHFMRDCRSARRCNLNGCNASHHRLIHVDRSAAGDKENQTEPKTEARGGSRIVGTALTETTDTLLQLVPVRIHGPNGERDVVALLDPGAQTSLCCEDVLEEIGVPGVRENLQLQNIEGSGTRQSSLRVQLTVSPLSTATSRNRIVVPEVWSVPSLNVAPPSVSSKQLRSWKHLQDLDLQQYNGAHVELLLGANILEAVLQREVRVGGPGMPVAIRTDFGWTLTGSISTLIPSTMRQVMFVRQRAPEDALEGLQELVQDWWTTEAFGTMINSSDARSQEDLRAMRILDQQTRKVGDRYEAGLLWGEDEPMLPDNWNQAYRRLQSIERKLDKQPELATRYQAIIDGYVKDGHARKLSAEEADEPKEKRWYLPHHAVVNPNKPGKLRIVFDAAATYQGVSLNSKLITGPDLLQSLPGVIMRFREGLIAVTADIKQMYHQVRIRTEDQPASSFLWRDMERHRKPDVYLMEVVIFGAKSSPATANYVLRKALLDYGVETDKVLSRSPEQLAKSFYMDDCLFSCMTEDAAKQLYADVKEALERGGSHLTKWRSSSPAVLKGVPESERASASASLCLRSSHTAEKTLGIAWKEDEDTLGFRLQAKEVSATKRGVLSKVSTIFDPLGIAAPVTVRAKMMMQRLWWKHLEWDEPLPEPELSQWLEWLSEAEKLNEVVMQRCVNPSGPGTLRRQLHVFCDASESAFGAVAYWRTTSSDGLHHCRFLIGKCRVAPLKRLSIVRLELQAAVLGARLVATVLGEITQPPDDIFCWTDSKVVQQYLGNETRRFKTFVANRLAEIHELTHNACWLHVPGKLNPADDCSRGVSVLMLSQDGRWLTGPTFLREDVSQWPPQEELAQLAQDEEMRDALIFTTTKCTSEEPIPARFSSWGKFKRVVGWMMRFTRNMKACLSGQLPKATGPLSRSELQAAEVWVVAREQAQSYAEEVRCLTQQRPLPSSSSLLPLAPFQDEDGLIRVGGRIGKAATVTETASHRRAPVDPPTSSSIFILDTGGGGDTLAVTEALQHALRVPILVESKALPLDSNRNPVLSDESTAGGGRLSLTTVLARIGPDDSARAALDLMTVTYQQAQQLVEQSDESEDLDELTKIDCQRQQQQQQQQQHSPHQQQQQQTPNKPLSPPRSSGPQHCQ
ncbi:uncharacterized protein LOC122376197, partial [Amphibalanus amphitrite]|uniref:uncharacterized protein LOC122376197 n=1 Tax=Amphibalanus amphitrite TaxID=1232801 RepID=UPI001C90CE36